MTANNELTIFLFIFILFEETSHVFHKVSRCIKDLNARANKIINIIRVRNSQFFIVNNQKVSAGNFQRIKYVRASFEKGRK